MSHLKHIFILWSCLILVGVVPLVAQEKATLTITDLTLTNFPDMEASLSIVNARGVPVSGLTVADVEILEDNQPVTITNFEARLQPETPVALALVLDLSGSTPLPEMQAAVRQLLDYLGSEDQIALIGFNQPVSFDQTDPFKETDFTSNKELIRTTLDNLVIESESALYEAIHKAILITAEQPVSRRAVVVVSDGYDSASRPQITDALAPRTIARDKQIPIFTLGLFSQQPANQRDPDYLKVLASESGGEYQEVTDLAELGQFFQMVADQLQSDYQLTFSLNGARDAQTHQLDFQVTTLADTLIAVRMVTYPEPLPVPEIIAIQQGDTGELADLPPIVAGVILIVPQIESAQPLTQVAYRVDGQLVDIVEPRPELAHTFNPWEWLWDTRNLDPGPHQLSITAIDEAGSATMLTLENIQIGDPATLATNQPADTETPLAAETEDNASQVSRNSLDTLRFIVVIIIMILAVALVAIIGRGVLARRSQPQGIAAGSSLSPSDDSFSFDTDYPHDTGGVQGGDSGLQGPKWRDLGTLPGDATKPEPVEYNVTNVEMKPDFELGDKLDDKLDDEETEIPYQQADIDEELENAHTVYLQKNHVLGWLVQTDQPTQNYELRKAVTTIGRTRKNDIVLKDTAISRTQARILLEEGIFYIHNLSHTNPTTINGVPANGQPLKGGDEIEIGRIKLIFKPVENAG